MYKISATENTEVTEDCLLTNFPSSRRKPGSSYLIFLDSRLRGNDDCRINQTFLNQFPSSPLNLVIPAKAGQKRGVERPQGRPEGRAKRVIQGFE